jgi:hypothetical protein
MCHMPADQGSHSCALYCLLRKVNTKATKVVVLLCAHEEHRNGI